MLGMLHSTCNKTLNVKQNVSPYCKQYLLVKNKTAESRRHITGIDWNGTTKIGVEHRKTETVLKNSK